MHRSEHGSECSVPSAAKPRQGTRSANTKEAIRRQRPALTHNDSSKTEQTFGWRRYPTLSNFCPWDDCATICNTVPNGQRDLFASCQQSADAVVEEKVTIEGEKKNIYQERKKKWARGRRCNTQPFPPL